MRLFISLAVAFLALPASAEIIEEYALLGHAMTLERTPDGLEMEIKLDGEVLHRQYYLAIDRVELIDGIPVAVGWSSAGGNVCAENPFVLVIPEPNEPRLDGPLDNCGIIEIEKTADGYRFIETIVPGARPPAWGWTIAGGIEVIDLPIAEPQGGWGDLDIDIDDGFPPYQLLANAAAVKALGAALGEGMVQYRALMGEAGLLASTEMVGTFHLVDTFDKFAPLQYAKTYIDPVGGQVFVILDYEGQEIIGPDLTVWPKILREDIAQ